MSSPSPDSAAPPILVLVPSPGGDPIVLGLGLVRRAELAARRAGYGSVIRLSDGNALAAAAAPLVIAPATVVAESDWLERVARTRLAPDSWAVLPGRLAMVPAARAAEAVAALAEGGGVHTMRAIEARLTRRLGPPAALPDEVDPLVVAGPADRRAAERRLLRALVKDTDGFMARHVERPVSLALSRLLAATQVTPNQMTLFSVAVGLAGAPFFLSVAARWQTAGALLLLAHSILDGCDGELARLKFQESRRGGILDFWGDNVVHSVTFACMAAGWASAEGAAWPALLGAAAVMGTLASAAFVYRRVMAPKRDAGPLYTSVSTEPGRRLTRLLDALSRRDFIYLVVAFALFGKAGWFLVLTALGAPTFFFLLLVLAARERAAAVSAPSGA